MTLDEKFQLCRAVGEECIQEAELRTLLDKKPVITAYDGFEPSGRMHIAQVRYCDCFVLCCKPITGTGLKKLFFGAGGPQGPECECTDTMRRHIQVLVGRLYLIVAFCQTLSCGHWC